MARRSSKADKEIAGGLVVLGVIAAPVYIFDKINVAVGWKIPTAVVVGIIFLVLLRRWKRNRARLHYLRSTYLDEGVVQKILSKTIWLGQTERQLIDSLGPPSGKDQKLLKTKTREVWKYYHQGANRYRLRVTVEDGSVSGWESKSG
ncbi:hypothetical protein [Pseudomonas syringae]|uniref:hypothetical protein n=1 Tax=Pseudomonas syringae TaxID=317 RepID=UPI001EFC4531|nr:hypothetical protein [Pseudomonas syringae]